MSKKATKPSGGVRKAVRRVVKKAFGKRVLAAAKDPSTDGTHDRSAAPEPQRLADSDDFSSPGDDSPCNEIAEPVESVQLLAHDAPAPTPGMTPAPSRNEHTMNLTLKRSDAARKGVRLVIYNFTDGRAGSVQFLRTAFPKDAVPDTITMEGDFAEYVPKEAKVKETAAERKARLAALPKLTLAEKVARAEKRTADLRAKLAKAQAE